jgi:large subunit ribosomal protein L25
VRPRCEQKEQKAVPEITSLNAERRARAGKGAARATRRMGRVPGIIYGGKQDPLPISFEPRELSRAIARRGFLATLIDVTVDGAVERTLPREVQHHPVTDKPLHVDFMRVGADTRVTVTVPVVFINHELSLGLRRGGILNIVRHGVELSCRADSIPHQLVVDLDGLDIGDSVHATAISFPAGSRPTITDRDFTIASIGAPSALREEAAAAAAAPPPAAEPPAAS